MPLTAPISGRRAVGELGATEDEETNEEPATREHDHDHADEDPDREAGLAVVRRVDRGRSRLVGRLFVGSALGSAVGSAVGSSVGVASGTSSDPVVAITGSVTLTVHTADQGPAFPARSTARTCQYQVPFVRVLS